MKFENFERYFPEDTPSQFKGYNVAFFRDKDGNDFYDICKSLSEKTLKVLYIDDKICSFSYAADSLYPGGYSLVEVEPENVPIDLDDISYKIDHEKAVFYKNPEHETWKFTSEKDRKLQTANQKITHLQDKIDIGIASPAEIEGLKTWKKFRVSVVEAETYEDLPDDIKIGG